MAPDDRHVYLPSGEDGLSPDSGGSAYFVSGDSGDHWQGTWSEEGYGGGTISMAISPVAPRRLYAVFSGGNHGGSWVIRSDTAGDQWRTESSPAVAAIPSGSGSYYPWGGLVADPIRADTVYANFIDIDAGRRRPAFVTRSDDAGLHWSLVMTPTVTPPLRTFSVSIDIHEGTALVGRGEDRTVPADRRYLSTDEGRAWRPTTCPGDLAAICPIFVVDNVFGAGASYAFTARGIYRFHGGGSAETRLAISDRLPVPLGRIVDVTAGRRFGDPIYLLARGGSDEALYRSDDAGRAWQRLPMGILPSMVAPGHAPGALYVFQTGHGVAPPFVAMYRRLGVPLIGYPIVEAYREGDILTQDFERLRLQLRQGRVVVGRLGAEVEPYEDTGGADPFGRPAPAAAPRRLFPQTGHTVRGEFLLFWEAHDGRTTSGAPISDLEFARNGDGSGRIYAVQWFEKARLEWRPEVRDPNYAVQLGLVGRESLYARGWLPLPSIMAGLYR